MQDQYFSLWLGKWTTAIDWTAAVTGTYISAILYSLSRSVEYVLPGAFEKMNEVNADALMVENEINKYFGQSVASYYGEEAFAIRMQAYDDMLWVVLEWLESIKFIESHSSTHFASNGTNQARWHAQQFVPAFAHRARIFYDLAKEGWDWRLCGGGMTWNPHLLPYKNAITNQLFISASINMYLHFPGDGNRSPFRSTQEDVTTCIHGLQSQDTSDCDSAEISERNRYDLIFRQNAIDGYNWLKNSGMLNKQGLYTDGFHIRDYRRDKNATTCDERNEMVYTYNQGVVLSGLRGLWEATGNLTYLVDGHNLVRNVIRATGWDGSRQSHDIEWHGLGSSGILTEVCDPSGSCNQDGQTFKGIFFHHLTAFCEPLPRVPVHAGKTHGATEEEASYHWRSCRRYTDWIVHNAQAALRTRDSKGRFGSWWGASADAPFVPLPRGAIDYRNLRGLLSEMDIDPEVIIKETTVDLSSEGGISKEREIQQRRWHVAGESAELSGDLNDRGRGRTVETQGGGIAIVRAMYEFLKREK
jgi:hypothetical protein